MSGTISIAEPRIVQALKAGTLTPAMVGVAQFEVRYHAQAAPRRRGWVTDCDLICHYYTNDGRVPGNFLHCEESKHDIPSDIIEGIGAEYLDGTTVSYISDDHELTSRIEEVLRNA